jgi:hypothetical protein
MRRATLAALTLAATAGIPPAEAQEEEPGPPSTLTATISQSAVLDTNYDLDDPSPGNSYYGDTRVGLGYLRQTATQSFALGLDTGLRALWQAQEDEDEQFEFRLASPSTANVDFIQEGPNTTFDGGARLRVRRVDFTGPLDIDGGIPDDLSGFEEDAYEYRSDADLGLVLGTSAPSSYEFRLIGTDIDYSEDTGDTGNLVPRRSVEGQAAWTLALTPVFSTIVFGSYYYYDDETDDIVKIGEAEAGLVYEPSEVLRVRGGIGYADRRRWETIGGVNQQTEHDTGPTLRGDFRYLTPEFTLQGEGRLTAAAPETRLSGVVRAIYTLPRGRLVGRVFQRYGGDQSGADSRITGAGIGLVHDINTVSRLEFDAAYAQQVDEDDPAEPKIDRTTVGASYIYDLTETVSAELGYGLTHRVEDPDEATSNRFFVVIGKTFETGL